MGDKFIKDNSDIISEKEAAPAVYMRKETKRWKIFFRLHKLFCIWKRMWKDYLERGLLPYKWIIT